MKNTMLLIMLTILAACTSVSYESKDGTKFSVVRFSPVGEDLAVSGTLDGIGNVDINKQSEGSAEFAQAVLDGLVRAAGATASPGL